MTKIIGFGHYKQSGKSSSCEFIKNELEYGCKYRKYWQSNNQPRDTYTVKIYSFADKLKEFCVDVLGLSIAQCYGSDEDKNSLTHIRWENMPGIISNKQLWLYLSERHLSQPIDELLIFHEAGFMTAREVLQYFGTGICRKMYSDVWVDACLRQIKKDNLDFALIGDCRFKNEAEAIQAAGGKIIGFTRRPFPEDNHASEVDLIGYPFDATIDNVNMSLDEKNEAVLQIVKDWGWL